MPDPDPRPLDYLCPTGPDPTPAPPPSGGWILLAFVLAILLTFAHLAFTIYIGDTFHEMLGHNVVCVAPPVHLPAGYAAVLGISCLGMLLALAGSIVAGVSASRLLVAWLSKDRPILGKNASRLWWFLLGWAMIPIPPDLHWVRLLTY